MKIGTKTICVIGNYSGRNAGDAAMLEGILSDLSLKFPDTKFLVPTLIPSFIRRCYSSFNVEPVNVAPWRGSLKLLGYPTWHAMMKSDLTLITDAILFDINLYNPMHNYLSTLALWVPAARKRGVPVVPYNASLGPITTKAGHWCLKQVLQNSAAIILRDDQSLRAIHQFGIPPNRVYEGADSALLAKPASQERVFEIMCRYGATGRRPRVGININSYGTRFLKKNGSGYDETAFLSMMRDIVRWVRRDLGADVWLFCTQHMDRMICRSLQRRIRPFGGVPLFTNRELSYGEILGLFARLDLLVGMRTHSIILASSAGTPVASIVPYPKTYGYLERIGQQQFSVPLDEAAFNNVQSMIRTAWAYRAGIRAEISDAVAHQRELARNAAQYLSPYLSFPVMMRNGGLVAA